MYCGRSLVLNIGLPRDGDSHPTPHYSTSIRRLHLGMIFSFQIKMTNNPPQSEIGSISVAKEDIVGK